MKGFFKVTPLERLFEYSPKFGTVGTQHLGIMDSISRILAKAVTAPINLPGFARSTMDGYAVQAASTFGASESNPAYLEITSEIRMGQKPEKNIGPGEAARIPTGAMLPDGADAVVMVEHAEEIDETTLEVYKSAAPGTHVVEKDEDIKKKTLAINKGTRLRPQEIGLLAALGYDRVMVYRKPKVSVISTGDELTDIKAAPGPGSLRDINTYTISAMLETAGCRPVSYGIVPDDFNALKRACERALLESDAVLVSGGSSVGTRDLTIDVIRSLPCPEILVHGLTISPGKPTILARVNKKQLWGLPGHVTSAMIVFDRVIRPFLESISGLSPSSARRFRVQAHLSRNIASAQGRVDFIRVRLVPGDNGTLIAEPVPGKSGLIRTMVSADGLIEINMNTEGLNKGDEVAVIPL